MTGRVWAHPAIAGKHLVRMTRDYTGDVAWSVATCQCGWSFRETAAARAGRFRCTGEAWERNAADPVHQHWLEAIARAEGAPA